MNEIAMGCRMKRTPLPMRWTGVLCLLLGSAGAALAAPSAEQVIMACMKVEVPRTLQKLGIDPMIRNRDDAGAAANAICRRVAALCAEMPDGEGCQKVLLDYGLSAHDYKPSPGALLFEAAYLGRTEQVHRLLADEVDVNWQNLGGWTPLMIAAAERRIEIVKLLLAARADPNLRNAHGRTALMFAAGYGELPIVEALLKAGAGADLVPTDHTGWTALVAAAAAGHVPVVRALLKAGADPHIKTRDGLLASDLAAAHGHRALVDLLQAAERGG